jgi:Zn-dependent protease
MLILIALASHEAAHLISSVILNIKMDKFKVTIFGFNINTDLEQVGFFKKLLLFLAGPACNIFLFLLFKNTAYNNFAQANLFLAIVNMLPVVPLDGGNICKSVLQIFLDLKSVCRYMIMTNTFFIVCFLIIIHIHEDYLFFILIIMSLRGILEENQYLIEKSIRKKYNLFK